MASNIRTEGHIVTKSIFGHLLIDGHVTTRKGVRRVIGAYAKYLRSGFDDTVIQSAINLAGYRVWFSPKHIQIGCEKYSHAAIMEIALFIK